MGVDALVDTGPLLALLDPRDSWHFACRRSVADLRMPLVTSAAVLTELFHLVGDRRAATRQAWKLIRSGLVSVAPIEDADLPALDALMARYADRPMDFADATLVLLASRTRIGTVFTVDHDDFETYRVDGRRSLRIVPPRDARG